MNRITAYIERDPETNLYVGIVPYKICMARILRDSLCLTGLTFAFEQWRNGSYCV